MAGGDRTGPSDLGALAHELRNILGPAMMAAERLSGHADPKVVRMAQVVLDQLDKAVVAIRAARASSE